MERSFLYLALMGFFVFLPGYLDSAQNEEKRNPLKVDLELKRIKTFLSISVICKNISDQTQEFRLILSVQKSGKGESKIYQAKTLKLFPGEISLPFLAQFSINPEDSYLIVLEVKDFEGRLIERKEITSEGL